MQGVPHEGVQTVTLLLGGNPDFWLDCFNEQCHKCLWKICDGTLHMFDGRLMGPELTNCMSPG